jgi:glycerophosphoryl diester phosphodiesterase
MAAEASGGHETLIVAHRGAWDRAPQNSAAALEGAIALGCDMVELDVRRTRDDRLVVVHNARVGGTAIAHLDVDELRARLAPGQAPLLEELLELAAGRIKLDVELKEDGYVERVLSVLGQRSRPGGYVVTSFVDSVLATVHRIAPETRSGLLLRPGRPPARLAARLQQTGAAFLAPPLSLARAGLLAWADARGIESVVWTVNDPRWLEAMLADRRVAGVITDRPAAALALRS